MFFQKRSWVELTGFVKRTFARRVFIVSFGNGPIYEDATYKYFGRASAGSDLTDPAWEVSRLNIATGRIQYADGNTNFDNVYTSLAVVAALDFS